MWWWVSAAFAGSLQVVAVGDGLVTTASATAAPAGWIPVLQDCLEERAPGRWSVVDHSGSGPVIEGLQHGDGLRGLAPAAVVISFGARTFEGAPRPSAGKELAKTLTALRAGGAPPEVIVVGVAPAVAAAPADQAKRDEEIAAWNALLTAVAKEVPGVRRVDLLADWPTDPAARAGLTDGGSALSDQGHARVAAAVCDAVLAGSPAVASP